jgi:2-methylcitrate dehydratase
LGAADYEDDVASDPRIDALRAKITCVEDEGFSADYLDRAKRQIFLKRWRRALEGR